MPMTADLTIRETAALSGGFPDNDRKISRITCTAARCRDLPRLRGGSTRFSACAGRGVFSRPQGGQSDRPSSAPQALDLELHGAA